MSNLAASASAPATTGDIENPLTEDVKRKMYRAVLRDEWAEAKVLIEQNRELVVVPITDSEEGALHLSIAMKHKRFAKKLINLMKPEEVDTVDKRGYTACCYAAISDEMTDVAEQLVDKNSRVLATRNREGKTALQLASLNGKGEMISLLVSLHNKIGDQTILRDDEWFDILISAIRTKMYDIALQILDCKESLALHSKKREGADSTGKKEKETETTMKIDNEGADSTGKKEKETETTMKIDNEGADSSGKKEKETETTMKIDNEGADSMSKRDKGTALHILARQEMTETTTTKTAILFKSIIGTTFYGRQIYGEMDSGSRELAAYLLKKMKDSWSEKEVVDALRKPPILCDAAKMGNVELIVMITREYPDLMWEMDSHKRSIFHYAVIYRQDAVFGLIRQIGGLKNLVVMGEDADGNNILHLAAKLPHVHARDGVLSIPALQMQRELAWFKEVETIVPVTFGNTKNKLHLKPRKLFSEEHKDLLKESKDWTKSTADSCMLIATIILTVVYAAAFTVPGGNNEATGLPILERSTWFTCFFVFEALALFGSTLCVIVFWSITSSGFKEELFLYILPYQLKLGLSGLFVSLIGAISAFMSAYCLVLVDEREWHMKSVILLIYVMLVLAVCGRFCELWFTMKFPKALERVLLRRDSTTLFSG